MKVSRSVVREVTDKFKPLGFTAAQSIQRLAKRQVAQADFLERGQPVLDIGMTGKKGQCIGYRGGEQISDGLAVPSDGQHLGLETAALANGTRHEDVGQKLHLHALAAEALAMVAAALAAVERKTRRAETGFLGRGHGGVKLADQFPRFAVQRRIRTRRAAEGRLIDEHDLGENQIGLNLFNRGRILRHQAALGEQALVDDVVEQGGFA